jgi:5-methylcytosine-specific restriction enzyme subunit McrC
MRISDNSQREIPVEMSEHMDNYRKMAQLKINNENDESNLLFFTNKKDKIKNENIFSIEGTKMTTKNIMGFVGLNGSDVAIRSRFASEDKEDFFLHYMLQKVFSINLFDMKHSSAKENIFDFLLYLFPFFLKKAIRQGLYKEYKRIEHNNSSVKGTLNVTQHIKSNIPFVGKVAYSTREHSYDNKITQLIRHTIDFIGRHQFAHTILTSDSDIHNSVQEIILATPSFDRTRKAAVMNSNLRPVVHPYFSEYRELQKICLQILRYEGLKYAQEKDKIYGLLFDGSWLWEEYLNTILKDCGFKHPRNDISKGGIYLFKDPKGYKRYPDFWKENFILDAKYKRPKKKVVRDDMTQIISYMYVKCAELGGFIYPVENESGIEERVIGILNGYGGKVKTWAFSIPQKCNSFPDFCIQISESEKKLSEIIKRNDKELLKLDLPEPTYS